MLIIIGWNKLPYQPYMMTSSNGNIFRVTDPLCGEFLWLLVNSSHKGQWRVALMFCLICAWINGWANIREADDLRCHRAYYDVTVMYALISGSPNNMQFGAPLRRPVYTHSLHNGPQLSHITWTSAGMHQRHAIQVYLDVYRYKWGYILARLPNYPTAIFSPVTRSQHDF